MILTIIVTILVWFYIIQKSGRYEFPSRITWFAGWCLLIVTASILSWKARHGLYAIFVFITKF